MKDKWLNIGYEDKILSPHTEEAPDYADPERIRELFNVKLHGVVFQSDFQISSIYLLFLI